MASDDYYMAGVAIAVSLVHDGPAPHCMSPDLYDSLVRGPQNVNVSLSDMPLSDLRQDLETVSYDC